MLKFQILMSAMHQTDCSNLEKSNVKCNAIIVNQCDEEGVVECCNGKMINTLERGLSRSRNLAIANADAEYCLLSDDDEFFVDDVDKVIVNAYEELPDADIIIFGTDYKSHLHDTPKKLKRLELLKVSSVQISFKLSSIKDKISFDTKLGAGTGNGAGEETKFLWDSYGAGLKIYYYPVKILKLREKTSTWFAGYDEKYFYNRGMVTRYIMGKFYSTLYAYYYALSHKNLFKQTISPRKALKSMLKGVREDKLNDT